MDHGKRHRALTHIFGIMIMSEKRYFEDREASFQDGRSLERLSGKYGIDLDSDEPIHRSLPPGGGRAARHLRLAYSADWPTAG